MVFGFVNQTESGHRYNSAAVMKDGQVLGVYNKQNLPNYSVFDVANNDALHEALSGLPLFPYMKISVTPLAKHPSSIR